MGEDLEPPREGQEIHLERGAAMLRVQLDCHEWKKDDGGHKEMVESAMRRPCRSAS